MFVVTLNKHRCRYLQYNSTVELQYITTKNYETLLDSKECCCASLLCCICVVYKVVCVIYHVFIKKVMFVDLYGNKSTHI